MAEERKVLRSKALPGPNSMAALLDSGPTAIRTLARSHGHADPNPTMMDTDLRASAQVQQPRQSVSVSKPASDGFSRGMIVKHTPTGKKVTILSISASQCEVVDNRGKKWLANKSNLQ